ncbi:hypothetical protein BC628DRAFT_1307400 [Trametes gibbosa]|nr:hypothetical protein BC628DRAFT_1307400 [Trametes gibbosa]
MAPTFSGPLHVLEDSGAPVGSHDFTTVVILHGFTWHTGIFTKLIPLAHSHNARILLVNRRDYPGSDPLPKEECALLHVLSAAEWENPEKVAMAKRDLGLFMEHRARELYDLLVQLVQSGDVSKPDRANNKGGIVVAGWSLGGAWMTSLLAHAASFSGGDTKLRDFLRRVVLYDVPDIPLGLPPPVKEVYIPIFDTTIPLEERVPAFLNWITGYFEHGNTPETLENKVYLQDPPPTVSALTPEQLANITCMAPGMPGGSDDTLVASGVKLGLFASLKERALYPPKKDDAGSNGDAWREVEVRFVTCERSISGALWARMLMRKEVEEAKAKGLPMRDIQFVAIRGANHFVRFLHA